MLRINRPIIYILILCAFYAELTVLHRVTFHNAQPDILLGLTIFFGLFAGIRYGVEAGILAGFLRDISGTGPFGFFTLLFGLAGLVCGALSDRIYREHVLVQFSIVFGVAYIASKQYLPGVFYTSTVAVVMFFILQRVVRADNNFQDA